jgi:hypothetical protein
MSEVERAPPMDMQLQSHMKPIYIGSEILGRKYRVYFNLWNQYDIELTLQKGLLSVYISVLIIGIYAFACLYAIKFLFEKSILCDFEI